MEFYYYARFRRAIETPSLPIDPSKVQNFFINLGFLREGRYLFCQPFQHSFKGDKGLMYHNRLHQLIKPKKGGDPLVLDLFAGCGGLGLGFEAQGFETHGFEMDGDCCQTYQKNLLGRCQQVFLTPDYRFPEAQVIIGGPPCQPFSVGGNQIGSDDARNGFPAFISAIDQVRPDIWMFENVRGLMYRNKWYFDSVVSDLEKLGYIVEHQLLNAIDFDVPQNRERIIVVGHRGGFSFPTKMGYRVTAGEAVGDLALTTPPESKFLTSSMDQYIAKYEKASKCINPRDLHLNKPARTLTCRNLAGATGDMQRVRLLDGRRRRLLAREAARLQSFPDWFEFTGGETSVFNQIGNAVAPMFAYHLAASVRAYLNATLVDTVSISRSIGKKKIVNAIRTDL